MRSIFLSIAVLFLLSSCARDSAEEIGLIAPSEEGSIALLHDKIGDFQVGSYSGELTKEDKRRLYRTYPITLQKIQRQDPLSLQDIKNLTRSGVADEVIISQIASTRSYFYLTPEDLDELREAGVSERVISEMEHTTKAVF